jgi:hypothetical protein
MNTFRHDYKKKNRKKEAKKEGGSLNGNNEARDAHQFVDVFVFCYCAANSHKIRS